MTEQQAFKTLGLNINASQSQIKKAYHKYALLYHPDKNPNKNTHEKFIAIVEAFEILSIKYKPKSTNKTHTTNNRYTYKTKKESSFHFRNSHHIHRDYGKPNYSQEEFEKRYARAKAMYEANLERKSQKIYQDNFDEYKNGYQRKFSMIMAALGIILAFVFTIDSYFLMPIYKDINLNNQIYHYAYTIDTEIYHTFKQLNQTITISNDNLKSINKTGANATLVITPIFKDIIELDKAVEIGRPKIKIAELENSLHHYFGLFIFLLLVPILTFWLERPTFNFVFFGIYYNILIFPILILFILFNDGRIIRLFESISSMV